MKKLEKELLKRYNEVLSSKIYVSWRTFLECAYETASEKKQYHKCAMIQDLIIHDIYN